MRKIWIVLCMVICTSIASYADINSPYREGMIEGYVKEVMEGQIKIEEYDGTIHLLPLDKKIDLRIDGIPVTLKDYRTGMEVYGKLQGRRLKYLESYSTENMGYIPKGGRMRSGIVKSIDRDQITVNTLIGQTKTFVTSPATIVLKKGNNTSLSNLYEGDHVKLYFDDTDTNMISRMHIEGDSVLIKDLYKGRLSRADDMEDEVVFDHVEVFRNGSWETFEHSIAIPYNEALPLYVAGQKVPYENLKYYQGKTVYMAIKNFFGTDKAEKMVVKSQYEKSYSDKIDKINWYSQTMELKNHQNLRFSVGTMVIKNGRLVDQESINPNADAFIVGDGRGQDLHADVISIYNEDLNHSNLGQNYIYAGRLSRIFENKVYLKDFYLLHDHEWESFRTRKERDEKELYYDEDTSIYDAEEGEIISAKAFFAKDYSVDEDDDYIDDHKLEDWYAYIYTDGDRIASIMLQKDLDSLRHERITAGVVDRVDDDRLVSYTIYLRDAKDYSDRHEKWMPKNATLRVNLKEALIIKDGKAIEPQKLRPSDRLYMVRDDFYGKVVVVTN